MPAVSQCFRKTLFIGKNLGNLIRAIILALCFTQLSCTALTGKEYLTKSIKVQPEVAGATIVVTNKHRVKVASGCSPLAVHLRLQDGYMSGADYVVEATAPGYSPQTLVIESDINGWYFTNLLIPGELIWLFLVDPLNHKMFECEQYPEYEIILPLTAGSDYDGGSVDYEGSCDYDGGSVDYAGSLDP
jgi:hypothetical protein